MKYFKIGAMMDSFKLPTKEAILKVKEVGATGFQMYSTNGENSPENLTKDKRKELLKYIKDNGLVVSAICGDLGQGFGNPEKNPALIEKSKRIMELAKDMETDVVTTHIGVVPSDESNLRYEIMHKACRELAEAADSMEAHFAVETGPETAITLKKFLDSLNSKGVAVNLDPANLVMVTGDDPVKAVYTLRDYIVHTHAKDGVKLYHKDSEVIYGVTKDDALVTGPSFREEALGNGSVDFDNYLKALHDIGYNGFLTIEREVGADPIGDITRSVVFLKEKIEKMA